MNSNIKQMDSPEIKYIYKFKLKNGKEKDFEVRLDRNTLNMMYEPKESYPRWTELVSFKCPNCPLDEKTVKYCPVITKLFDVIEFFKDSISHEEIDLYVESEDRTYLKKTSLQNGLNALFGIIMPTSGCPNFDKLKPMVRFHLPFTSLEETSFRMMSMYLLAQYFVYKNGGAPDWEFRKLVDAYNEIRIVNKNFCNKLSEIKVKDAAINALVTLDCFAFTISYFIDQDKLEKMKKLFSAYYLDLK